MQTYPIESPGTDIGNSNVVFHTLNTKIYVSEIVADILIIH